MADQSRELAHSIGQDVGGACFHQGCSLNEALRCPVNKKQADRLILDRRLGDFAGGIRDGYENPCPTSDVVEDICLYREERLTGKIGGRSILRCRRQNEKALKDIQDGKHLRLVDPIGLW